MEKSKEGHWWDACPLELTKLTPDAPQKSEVGKLLTLSGFVSVVAMADRGPCFADSRKLLRRYLVEDSKEAWVPLTAIINKP